jgi:transcriptional regulator with XRE-family HTH domain
MEYRNKVKSCLTFVKAHLKKQKVTYQQLADRLDVSLLTIKRQLNGDEISMSKLLGLCDAAGASFTDIWQQVEERKVQHTVFTVEQDLAFYKFPHLLHYFLELFCEKNSPEHIQEKWQLSPASTHIYLRELEKLALLNLSPKGTPTFLITEPIGFGSGSLNIMKEIQRALVDVSEKLINERDEEPFIIVKPLLLTDKLRSKMYEELMAVVSSYSELSERYYNDSQFPAGQLVICDYKPQQQENILCDIINVVSFN